MSTAVIRPVTVHDARDIAQVVLGGNPRRWQHTIGVARRAEQLAVLVEPADRDILLAAAWLHDIGHAEELIDTGFAPVDGARFLDRHVWPRRISALVANHSGASFIAAARGLDPERLVVYFQPHQPWRTRAFAPAFIEALAGADVAVVSETYIARGRPDAETTARRIVDGLRDASPDVPVVWAPTYAEAVEALRGLVRPGDLVVCCGAGPVDQVARAVVA